MDLNAKVVYHFLTFEGKLVAKIRASGAGAYARAVKGGKLSLSLLMSGSKAGLHWHLQQKQAHVDKVCPKDAFPIILPLSVFQIEGNYICQNETQNEDVQ